MGTILKKIVGWGAFLLGILGALWAVLNRVRDKGLGSEQEQGSIDRNLSEGYTEAGRAEQALRGAENRLRTVQEEMDGADKRSAERDGRRKEILSEVRGIFREDDSGTGK